MTGPRILIEGVGGIGGVMAARLGRAGNEVVLVTGNPDIAAAINDDGLQVTTPGERFTHRARAFTSLGDLPDLKFDLALLVMKAHTVVEAARGTMPLLEQWGYVVTCQNGIVEDDVAAAVGRKRVVPAIVGWGGTMHAPGVYEKTGPGEIHVGEIEGGVSGRIRELARTLECVTPVVVSRNMRGALWSKLAINCTITTMGALTGETLGVMLREKRIRDVALEIYSEVLDTAEALGVKLEKIAAPPRLLYLPAGAGGFTRWWKDVVARIVARRYGRLRSSMLQTLERGRRTEIDFLNGYVVRKAGQVGVETPVNERLVAMIREVEEGRRKMSMGNLEELAPAG